MTQIWQNFLAASGGQEKSGILDSQMAILQGKSVIWRSQNPKIFLPPKAAEKIAILEPPNRRFQAGKRSETGPKLSQIAQNRSAPGNPPLFSADFFTKGGGS